MLVKIEWHRKYEIEVILDAETCFGKIVQILELVFNHIGQLEFKWLVVSGQLKTKLIIAIVAFDLQSDITTMALLDYWNNGHMRMTHASSYLTIGLFQYLFHVATIVGKCCTVPNKVFPVENCIFSIAYDVLLGW